MNQSGIGEKTEITLHSIKTLVKDYDSIYRQATVIFNESSICQWEENMDGSFSCIVNRLNSQKNGTEFTEINGCCNDVCKHPENNNDKIHMGKQHSNKKGCLIKDLKCKLYVCEYLRGSSDKDTLDAIKKIDHLNRIIRTKYDILWDGISYGSSRKKWIEFYRIYRNIILQK